jgi:hypothetical protein
MPGRRATTVPGVEFSLHVRRNPLPATFSVSNWHTALSRKRAVSTVWDGQLKFRYEQQVNAFQVAFVGKFTDAQKSMNRAATT